MDSDKEKLAEADHCEHVQGPTPVYQPAPAYQPMPQQMQPVPGQPYYAVPAQQGSTYPYAVNWPNQGTNTVIVMQNPLGCSEAEYAHLKDRAICMGWVSLFCGALYCSIPALIMAYKERATAHDLRQSIKLSTAAMIVGGIALIMLLILILVYTGVIYTTWYY